jgi:hypothetical protein
VKGESTTNYLQLLAAYNRYLYAAAAVHRAYVSFKVGSNRK